jgi:hypothetical protein
MVGKACRIRLAATAAAIAVLGIVPAAAEAGVGASAVPSFPAAVTVGDTGVPASIEVRNGNIDNDAAATNTVCNFGDAFPCPAGDPGITLIPSCTQLGAFSACTGVDPGVFRISDTAGGAPGTACAGMTFNVSLIDPATGQMRFTPQGGAHVSLAAAGAACRIIFTFTVLRSPAGDQNPGLPGVQTVQVTDNTQYAGTLTASARGTTQGMTVQKATPALATTASGTISVGGRLTDTAVVSGLVNPSGGTVDFRLYGPDDATCEREPVFQSLARPLDANGAATSEPYAPKAGGVYRWRAFYSGDANNNAVAGACNDANESTLVIGPPTVTVETEQRRGRCVVTKFTVRVRVRAQGLRNVRVTLDGRTIKRSKRARFTLRVRTRALRSGRHVLRVVARSEGGRTAQVSTFKRCGSPSLPRFVG